jgi:hypothetical protein
VNDRLDIVGDDFIDRTWTAFMKFVLCLFEQMSGLKIPVGMLDVFL